MCSLDSIGERGARRTRREGGDHLTRLQAITPFKIDVAAQKSGFVPWHDRSNELINYRDRPAV